jgi:single-strand DNA-binding protein
MAGETVITVIGNLTSDPELRFTPSGAAVANFTVASTPRTFDRQSQEWKDGEALFLRCNVWRQVAENVAESLTRGSRVIVSGRLKQRSFDTKEGEKRTVIELEVDEIGPSLRYATAKVTKASRGEGGGGFGGGGGGFGSSGGGGGGSSDPWSTPAGPSDEPPFWTTLRTDLWRIQCPSPPFARSRRRSASSARTRRPTSTTRTRRCCGSSSPTAARSVPAASAATAASTSVTSPWP